MDYLVTAIVIALVFVIFSVLDAWLTVAILKRGGKEKNLALAWFMDRIGVLPTLLIAKGVGLLMVAVFYLATSQKTFIVGIGLYDLILFGVVIHNWYQWRKG